MRRTYRFPIEPQFLADWEDFVSVARRLGQTPAQLLQELIVVFLDEEQSVRSQSLPELPLAASRSPPAISPHAAPMPTATKRAAGRRRPPAVKGASRGTPGRKTSRRPPVPRDTPPKVATSGATPPVPRASPPVPRGAFTNTLPKFRLLTLVREMDKGDGVKPAALIARARDLGIDDPNNLMQKLIRRGVLYIHEGRCRTM